MTEEQTKDTESTTSSARSRRPSSSSRDSPNKESASEESSTKRRTKPTSSDRTSESSKSSQAETKRRSKPKMPAGKAALAALQQLQRLTTRAPESVVGINPHEDGWRVTVEVVESPRIPNTADIMAEYDVDIDSNGDLTAYTRKSRYFRGRTQGE